jgi:hypothetical protein
MYLLVHVSRFTLAFYQSEKFFYLKEQFVKLLADLELISICEHHEGENTA